MKLSLHIFSRPYVRAQDLSRDRIITFTLINRTEMSGSSPKDSECFFQCAFVVEDTEGSSCFLEYPEREGIQEDEEEQSLRLLYRHRKTFAVGHGCAAGWPDTEDVAVHQLRTDSLPTYEIKPILPREITGLELSMGSLSEPAGEGPIEACARLASEYKKWIQQQEEIVRAPSFPGPASFSLQRRGPLSWRVECPADRSRCPRGGRECGNRSGGGGRARRCYTWRRFIGSRRKHGT